MDEFTTKSALRRWGLVGKRCSAGNLALKDTAPSLALPFFLIPGCHEVNSFFCYALLP